MAWGAQLKRIGWYCIYGIDMIKWYSDKEYDEWWDSLTDEQQQRVIEWRKQKKQAEHDKAMESLYQLAFGAMYLVSKCM